MSPEEWKAVLGMRLVGVTNLTTTSGELLGTLLTFAGEAGELKYVKIYTEPARGGPELRVSVRDGLRAPEPLETAREIVDRLNEWNPRCDGFLGG